MQEKIWLPYYGGVIQKLLAEILNKRREQGKNGLNTCRYEDIPPRDFFAYLAEHPLPEVEGIGRRGVRANEVIRFINQTDDILNLKRGILSLLRLSGSTGHCPFPGEQYDPDLLDIEEKEVE